MNTLNISNISSSIFSSNDMKKNNSINNHLLEIFIREYSLQCEKAAIEMNSRVVQAAVLMQSSITEDKEESNSIQGSTSEVTYILNAVPFGVSEAYALFTSLASIPLGKLNLNDCYLGDSGIRTLCDALSTSSSCCPVLHELNLSGVSGNDASPLSFLITATKNLRLLDISHNKFGTRPSGLSLLCGAMQNHATLQEVKLADNMISGQCNITMSAIAEWIVSAGRIGNLNRIDLRFNILGFSRDVADIAIVLRAKRTIYGSHPLVDAIFFNNTLDSIDLQGNAIPTDVLDVIEAKLSVNHRTKEKLRKMYITTP